MSKPDNARDVQAAKVAEALRYAERVKPDGKHNTVLTILECRTNTGRATVYRWRGLAMSAAL